MAVLRPLKVVAAWLERSDDTLRDWYKRELFEHTACDLKTRAVLVDMTEAQRLSAQHPKRATHRRR